MEGGNKSGQTTSCWYSGRKANTGMAVIYSLDYREILPTLRKIHLPLLMLLEFTEASSCTSRNGSF